MKGPISLMVLALIIIGGSIAYKFVNEQPVSDPTAVVAPATPSVAKPLPPREIFAYVPSDTIAFFGGLEPVDFKSLLDVFVTEEQWIKEVNWDEASAELGSDPKTPPAIRFMAGLNIEYIKALQNTAQTTNTLGVGEKVDSVIYTIGMIPVLRVKLEDEQAFSALLDRAAQAANVTSEKRTIDAATYRAFSLDEPNSEKKTDVDLIAAIAGGYGVLTLSTPLEREKTLRLALGLDKPANPLSVATIDELQKTYKLHPAFIGYIDHREIMKGITQEDGNALGCMLDTLRAAAVEERAAQLAGTAEADVNEAPVPQEGASVASIRTPECQTELMAIADAWPRSVFGYSKFEAMKKPMQLDALFIIESRDKETLEQLRTLRGFLPAVLRDDKSRPLFGLGVGLNVSALTPVMSTITQNFLQKSYQCERLRAMQQSFAQSGGAMAVGMASGMFAGLKGVSAVVFDVAGQVDPANPVAGIQGIDAIVAITSDNPIDVLNAAKNMVPQLADLEVPLDGSPVVLPFPLPGDIEVKIAVTGKHIVLYTGPKATALSAQISSEGREPNGLFALSMDYGRQMRFITSAVASNPEMPAHQQQMLQSMQERDVQFIQHFDITPQGIVFETRMSVN